VLNKFSIKNAKQTADIIVIKIFNTLRPSNLNSEKILFDKKKKTI
jgi:hypothetical protein